MATDHTPDAEALAAIRAYHVENMWGGAPYCDACFRVTDQDFTLRISGAARWPCPVIRLLDAYDAALAALARERADNMSGHTPDVEAPFCPTCGWQLNEMGDCYACLLAEVCDERDTLTADLARERERAEKAEAVVKAAWMLFRSPAPAPWPEPRAGRVARLLSALQTYSRMGRGRDA